jgi:hypothetical protein
MQMRLTEKQALTYLENEHGIKISGATFRRDKTILKRKTKERLYHIAQAGFENQHLQSIDEIEHGIMLMWREWTKETDPFKRVLIIEKIINLRPLLGTYYDSTKGVIEKPEPEKSETIIQESTINPTEEWA